jgi:hypothetical protein
MERRRTGKGGRVKIEIGKRYLVTTDEWFTAPNGHSYKAVFGTVHLISTTEEELGFRPRQSANWFVSIGNMTIAGCQIHYAIRTNDASKRDSREWTADAEHGIHQYFAPSRIYFADERAEG